MWARPSRSVRALRLPALRGLRRGLCTRPGMDGETKQMNMFTAINDAMRIELQTNPHAVVFGEDVGFGGVFRCTQGLLEEFGSDRVLNMPINEQGLVGFGIGMSAVGGTAIAEVRRPAGLCSAHRRHRTPLTAATVPRADPVRGLYIPGDGPDLQRGCQVPLSLGRRVRRGWADDPGAGTGGRPRRALPLAIARGLLRAYSRAEGGLPARRLHGQGPAARLDPGQEPDHLPGAEDTLPRQRAGRAGGRLRAASGQGRRHQRGRAHHLRRVGGAGARYAAPAHPGAPPPQHTPGRLLPGQPRPSRQPSAPALALGRCT